MSPTEGFSVTHRRYVPHSHAHYGGNLVDGAYGLGLFGDVATELLIRTDGDEGLFAGYSHVCALLTSGDLSCWGRNNDGELGAGTFGNRGFPGPIEDTCR